MSSDYVKVAAELKRGTPPDALCAVCPWHRPCVAPPAVSEAELSRKIDEAAKVDRRDRPGAVPASTLLAVAVYGTQAGAGEQCPVFAQRLAGPDGRKYADGIRAMMRGE